MYEYSTRFLNALAAVVLFEHALCHMCHLACYTGGTSKRCQTRMIDYILNSLNDYIVIRRYDKFLVPGTSAAQLFLYDPEG